MLKGERDNKVAEEREKAEMDAINRQRQINSAVLIQAAWRGWVAVGTAASMSFGLRPRWWSMLSAGERPWVLH